ncbi:methyltransferase domain-containing protein [Pseudomonas putida]|uniref:glycosyltransferase family protein n=1 Tax=Pseudomonas putida TaxID=303 RepID=UPI0021601797|nr:glycosyltransferase [Pseudomonas putida]UVL79879.1 methyltransferase domain-containing protein [Pseudomonas putida]
MNNPTLEKPTVNTELPSPLADIHDRVMEAYYGKLGDQFMRETQSRIHWICAQVKGRRILDVGCSQGIVPLLLAREGCQVTGVDTSPQAIEEAKGYLSAEPAHIQQNVTYINSDFLALDTLEVEPDTVVISEVLEHLVRPELFVEKAYDLLKQGGRLVITVPFGVNDFIDHKHTFYLMEPFRLLAEHLQIVEVKMLGKWLGIVALKSEAHKPGTIDSLTVERVRELEKAFESIERTLRENLGSIGIRLADANKKYRSATEQIAQLKPEAQKADALAKQLQTRDADIAALQKSNREILEAKALRVQELESIKQKLDEANLKYRAANEQIGLLRPEAQKADALSRQLQEQQLEFATLEQSARDSLEASVRNVQELNEELDLLRSQLGEADQKCLSAAEQYTQLEQQFAALEEARLQSVATTERQLNELRAQNSQANDKLKAANEELTQKAALNAELNRELHDSVARCQALEEQLQAAHADLDQAQQNSAAQVGRIDQLGSALNQRSDELAGLLQSQRSVEEQLQATNAQLHQSLQNIDAQAGRIDQLGSELSQRATALEQAQKEQRVVEEQLLGSQAQLEQAQKNTDLQAGRINQLSSALNQRNSELEALQQLHQSTEEQLHNTAQQRAAAEERAVSGAASLAALQVQHDALANQLQELSEASAQAQQINATHVETIAALRKGQSELEAELESQGEHMGSLLAQSQQVIEEQTNINTALRTRQAELEAEMESELEYMKELQAQSQRANAAQAEIIALLKTRQVELEADLKDHRQAMNELQNQSFAQQASQAETIAELHARQAELEAQLLQLNDAQARAEREHTAQVNTINSLVENRSSLERQLQTLEVASSEARLAQNEQAEAIASLSQAKGELEEQLALETASRQAAETSLAATNEQWQVLRMQLESELNSSKAGLGAANLKYRTLNAEHIPQLKANLKQLLDRSSAQQRKIDELNANLERANTQRHLAEQRLVKTRSSMTYQLGYQIKNSANSLGGLVKLPVRLLRLYRKASQQRQQNEQKLLANEPLKALLPPAPVVQDDSYLKLPVALPTSEQSRSTLLRQADQPVSRLKVACVMDEFTFGSYRYECDLMQLTPGGWKAELEGFRPELLFIESAWRGKDELWGSKVGHNSQELQDILHWCRQNKVPTVFWNKEDPVHFETFLTTAKQFDHVFTTDIDCIHRYKGALGHDRVYLLPFACQPALHNPIELYERKDAFCFAGAYYARYPERTRDLGNFVCELPKFRPLEIFDRNFGKNDANYQFPEEYQPYIVGTLPFEKIDTAYKGYRYAINLNSIKQSQSMFARRVFELLGCNTITVSNFSRGVRLLFGDLVVTTDNGEEMLRRLQLLAEDPLNSDKLKLAALRKVMQEHTYTQRLEYVLSKVTGTVKAQRLPEIVVVAEAQDRQQFDMLRAHLNRQTYSQVRMVIITDAYQSSIVSDDPRILVLKPAQLKKTSLGELVGNTPWVAGFVPGDYYGPNYLLDLALATRYSQAQVVGKAAHFTCDGQNAQLQSNGLAYRPAQSLSARRSLVATENVAGQPLRTWLKSLPSLQYTHEQGLAIDPFNYCENGAAQHEAISAKVDDLELNLGMTIDQLQARAQAIAPLEDSHDSPEITGRELAEMFGAKHTKFLNLAVDVDNWRVSSTLADGKHEYVYALKEVSLDQLNIENRQLKLYLDCTPGLNLQLVVLFLDAEKQRISHVMQHANRNQTSEVPPEAAFVRFGLRAYAAGNTEIKALVLGHRDLQPSEMLGRSKHLVVTNHYPAYADLYRNGFVHSRVMAYQEQNVNVDIFRLRKNEAVSYHEFQNVDVVTGCQSTLAKMLESGQYKSVLVHFLDPDMWEVLKRFTHMVKVVVWVHGAEVQPWWRREYNYSDESQLAVAKVESEKRMAFWRETLTNMPANLKFVFVSRYFAEEVMEDVGFRIPEEQYEIIHNPIDTDTFSYHEKPVSQRFKVLSIRPYASAKYANDLSVEAIKILSREKYFEDIEFRMIGDGALFDETLADLRQFKNVIIERGFLRHEQIAALHKEYGLFLCPTRMDAQGVSRDEAMSSGLIAVTNGVTAIPEFVDHECGILAGADNAQMMADGIKSVIESPDLFSKMSRAAHKRVLKQTAKGQIIERELNIIAV